MSRDRKFGLLMMMAYIIKLNAWEHSSNDDFLDKIVEHIS